MLVEQNNIDKEIEERHDRINCLLDESPKDVIDRIIKEGKTKQTRKYVIKGSALTLFILKVWDYFF